MKYLAQGHTGKAGNGKPRESSIRDRLLDNILHCFLITKITNQVRTMWIKMPHWADKKGMAKYG